MNPATQDVDLRSTAKKARPPAATSSISETSSISGSSAGAFNRNRTLSLLGKEMKCLSKSFEEMRSIPSIVDELRAQVSELQRKRSPEQEGECAEPHAQQLVLERRKWHRERDALRKQVERLKATLKSQQEQRAVTLENYRILPDDEGENVVFSTETIALENEVLEARRRGCSQLSDMSQLKANQVDSVQRRNSGPHRYSNTAVSEVYLKTFGPNMKRSFGIGGTEKDPGFLASMVISFFTTCISISSLCKVAAEQIESRTLAAKAVLSPLGDSASRRKVSTEKPINITGHTSRATLTDGICAAYLAIDFLAREKELVSSADVVTFGEDSSSFGPHSMLGMVIVLTYFKEDGYDAAGHPRHRIVRKSLSPNATSCGDHIVQDVRRADGTLFGKAAPQNMVKQLFSSGHFYAFLRHRCVYGIMDKGTESMGAGKGRIGRILRHSFYGRGSPLEQIFGTREAVDAVMKSEDWPYLQKVMEFLGIPRNQQIPIRARPLPKRLDTSKPVFSVPFTIRILERRRVGKGEVPNIISSADERCNSRISTANDPLSLLPVFFDKNGLPVASYCDKHMIDRTVVAFTKDIQKFMVLALWIVREWRYMQNHIKLKYHVDMVLGIKIKGSGKPDKQHLEIREALGESYVDEMKTIMPRGLTRQEEAVESRWNMLHKTVSTVNTNRRLMAAVMPLALAEGTEDAKTDAAKAVCSKEGFCDEKKIRFSKKIGRAFGILVSPSMIVYIAVESMIYKLAWQPLLAACAHRSEFGSSSMRGLGSTARDVNFVLTRGLFVCHPSKHGRWRKHYRLGHRGFSEVERHGPTWLSSRLEKKGGVNNEPLRLIHLYGSFYTPSMGSAVSELRETIRAACYMNGPILSAEHQNIYAKERVERLGQGGGKEQNKLAAMEEPRSFYEKLHAAMWLVQRETNRAASCLRAKTAGIVSCPLGFLAALYDFDRVPFIPGELDLELDEDEELYMDIATQKALASAGCLLLQMREALQTHGQDLPNWLPEPLRTLVRENLEALATFAEGQQVDFGRRGSVSPGSERNSYPKPVTAFPGLCKLALQAGARPTNNNDIESKWSLLTHRYQSRVRNVGVEYMSNVFRQKDAISSNMLHELASPKFHQILQAAREFRARNKALIQSFYRVEQAESEQRQARHKKQQYVYECSNIIDSMQQSETHWQQPKKQRSKTSAQKGSDRKDRRRKEHSNSEGSSDSEEDPELGPEQSLASSSDSDSESESHPSVNSDNHPDDNSMAGSIDVSSGSPEFGEIAVAEPGISIAPETEQRSELPTQLEDANDEIIQSPPDLGAPFKLSNIHAAASSSQADCEHGIGPTIGNQAAPADHDISSDNAESDSEDLADNFDSDSSAEEENDSGTTFLSHPFPNPCDLTEAEAKVISPFKLSYIRYLISKKEWESTKVDFDSRKNRVDSRGSISDPLVLTRLDGKQFPLTISNRCSFFYVLYGDNGLELINIEKILWKVPEVEAENAKEARKKKQLPHKVCVLYTRALSTQQAIVQCKSSRDFIAPSTSGVSRPVSLGSKSLNRYLSNAAARDYKLFHKGDFPFETLAEHIVGFVAWEPLGASCEMRSASDCRALVTKINSALALAHGQVKISSLEEVDCVWCGPDFSERDGK